MSGPGVWPLGQTLSLSFSFLMQESRGFRELCGMISPGFEILTVGCYYMMPYSAFREGRQELHC